MPDDFVENLKEPSQWLRIAYMFALAVALYVASVVLSLLTIAQAVFSLLTGSDNLNLRALGKDLSTYVHQILAFLTYNSEFKPFPFSPYPGSEDASIVESTVTSKDTSMSANSAAENPASSPANTHSSSTFKSELEKSLNNDMKSEV